MVVSKKTTISKRTKNEPINIRQLFRSLSTRTASGDSQRECEVSTGIHRIGSMGCCLIARRISFIKHGYDKYIQVTTHSAPFQIPHMAYSPHIQHT